MKKIFKSKRPVFTKKEYDKIHIFHHNDLDGKMSAAVAMNAIREKILCIKNDNNYDLLDYMIRDSIKSIMIDYNIEIDISDIKENDLVLFLDYSFSKKENIDKLHELCDKNIDVIWIDHHETSKRLINENIDLQEKLYGAYINTSYCATYLSWIYFMFNSDQWLSFIRHFNDDSISIPYTIELTNDWDTFAKKDPNSCRFNIGTQFYESTLYDFYGQVNLLIILYQVYYRTFCRNETIELEESSNALVDAIINYGTVIEQFEKGRRKNLYDKYGWEFDLLMRRNNDDGSGYFHTLKGIAMNVKDNSLIFGKDYDNKKYQIYLIYMDDGDKYTCSLYTPFTNTFDMSILAGYFGGGGHKGAAGFTVPSDISIKKRINNTVFPDCSIERNKEEA